MRNKLFALFILIGVIAGFILVYMYFFLYYTSTLIVNTNIDTFQVSLFSKKTARTFEYSCEQKICTLSDIPPFDYNMTVSSSGYIDIVQSFTLKARSKQEVLVTLEKEVKFQKVDNINNSELSAQDKIAQIRKDKEFLIRFPLQSWQEVAVKETVAGLDIYFWDKKITTTSETSDPVLQALEVPDTTYIYVHVAGLQGIFDTSSQRLTPITFVPDIRYIKKGSNPQELIFVTDKGSFLYNLNTEVFTYFYLFLDYVSLGEQYVGVIYKDEEQKKKNYNIQDETENLIIRYDPLTKERKILYKTKLDIQSIKKVGEEIYFETGEGTYRLENY